MTSQPLTTSWREPIPAPYEGRPADVIFSSLQPKGSLVPRGRALFWEGDAQVHKIEVVDGVIRAVRLLDDGNRQILTFFWPGDVVLPAHAACQQFTAEAVTNCRVRFSPVANVCDTGGTCGARQVLAETLSLVTTMGQRNSTARIAHFLLGIRRHLPADPVSPGALRLLISRADIADHIGTSIETVCRMLADLKVRGLVDLPTRKTILFRDLVGLRRVAGH
ncbi:helix-turn-helix domain-containing protein [uncultured Methylobacterium sp.]|jgi:CRP/FNR family transcriptional regulator|uniref:Crp/Fnr family transcriptional regulator n=1 Tax=uncultured Methylobacterium sp. TaxID=157278 RepID=UPI00261E939E|nr:helix-turn-helix domain-containing protein [uncultured Methylobacterium sp.]